MGDVKLFHVVGVLKRAGATIPFTKEVKAMMVEEALETVYSEFGSRHKAKRFEVKITSTEEVEEKET